MRTKALRWECATTGPSQEKLRTRQLDVAHDIRLERFSGRCRRLAAIANCYGGQSRFVDRPQSGAKIPPLHITLPDGTAITSDQVDISETSVGGFFLSDPESTF
jgi:hypothetical protein